VGVKRAEREADHHLHLLEESAFGVVILVRNLASMLKPVIRDITVVIRKRDVS